VVSGAIRGAARALGKDEYGVAVRVFDAIPANVRFALLARQLRRSKIAVVLAEFGTTAVEVYPACKRAGIPLVTHFHGYDAFVNSVIEQYGAAYAEIFREGWPVVAVSESMKRQLVRLGAAPDQVHVVRYGIDLDRFRPQTPTPGLAVAAGRFVEKKAPDLVVRAFAQAAAAAPHAQLVMIGDGPLRPQIERLITQLGVDDRVTLAGERDHAWVAEIMSSATVFVQHSVVAADGDREGTPVAVLEAAAAGVPVVATSHEGIAEVVANRETGLLVEERDVEGMADALVALLLDPVRARRLGLSGRAHVEALCSREQSIAALWAVLERATRGELTST
jgi:colanic acid/amylovoran biosynthesis glycosyltransferase